MIRWLNFKFRNDRPPPGSQLRPVFGYVQTFSQIRGIQNIVVIYKNNYLPAAVSNPTQAGQGQADSFFPHNLAVRVPAEIQALGEWIGTAIVNDQQFPFRLRKRL